MKNFVQNGVDSKLITSNDQLNIASPCAATLICDSNEKSTINVTEVSKDLPVPKVARTPSIQSRHSDHTAVNQHSAIRAMTLVLSISFHAFFEGMALILQAVSWEKNIGLLTSILMHKSAIGLSMSFSIISSNLSPLTSKLCLLLWASIKGVMILDH